LRILNAAKQETRIENKNEQARWLRQFLVVFLAFQSIWLCFLIPYVIPASTSWVENQLGWYPIYVPLALLMYYLGTRGYLQVKQLRLLQRKEAVTVSNPALITDQLKSIMQIVETDRIYLDPALNLGTLATSANIPSKQISFVLNQHLGKSFNEFINEYRVKEVIARLDQADSEKFTIAGIAYDCGFNSQPTFQRAFKQVTGKTPSQYLSGVKSEEIS
jgi:AraC-like DNA-binding protein